ncbi:MAG TPA: VOC family protein [Streptosporangiaceae bacterium]|nr:VOC family protein [Streptosporangiaceae bacterium]
MDDVPQAIAFYQALFGWDIELGGPEVGGYSIAHQGGQIVAAISPKMGAPGAPSVWTTYLATDDVDATAAKIKSAGGQLLAEPMDVMEEGRMAVAMDPAGAVFGLWQGGHTTGLGVANEPGALVWNEQFSRDLAGSQAFYQAVFGYGYQDMSGDGFKYAMLMVGDHEVGGIGEYPEGTPAELPAAWATYFAVADTDAAVARVLELGGRLVEPAWDSPYGRMAVVADDQGAVFSVMSTDGDQEG